MKFDEILHIFRSESFTQKDKGTRFEYQMRSWLLSDPRYSNLTDVWLWSDFPLKGDFGGKDTGIDLMAYDCSVNGKSAIERIREHYEVTQYSKSLIINNPNGWSREHENPTYIFDQLLSIINLSVQTVDIVNNLPKLKLLMSKCL